MSVKQSRVTLGRTGIKHLHVNKAPVQNRDQKQLTVEFPYKVPKTPFRRIRDQDYWYSANNVLYTVNHLIASQAQNLLGFGSIWTGTGSKSEYQSQTEQVKHLPRKSWPRVQHSSQAWPSTPSFFEMMSMMRSGVSPDDQENLYSQIPACTTRVCLHEFNVDIELAKRIVSNNVIGIRMGMPIPSKFLDNFGFSRNFLILTTPYNMSAGLCRFLAGQWILNPSSLWLRRKVSLKSYLRHVPKAIHNRSKDASTRKNSEFNLMANKMFTSSDTSESDLESEHSSALD